MHNSFKKWSELEKWEPSLEELRILAEKIRLDFATANSARSAQEKQDDYMAHDIYFIHDALVFLEFEQGVSHADAGRVLRVLKYWCLAFRGARQHNYARECAEILLRWKYETTPASRAVLERLWFVNLHGKPGRWIASDLYLEHLNYWVKVSTLTLYTNSQSYQGILASFHRIRKWCNCRLYHQEGISTN